MNDEPVIELIIRPGSASAEEIAEVLTAISDLYVLLGGSPLEWKVCDSEHNETA